MLLVTLSVALADIVKLFAFLRLTLTPPRFLTDLCQFLRIFSAYFYVCKYRKGVFHNLVAVAFGDRASLYPGHNI